MRESLSYGMFPLLRDNMDTPNFNPGSTSLISSNGYYGFQPQINPPQKSRTEIANEEHATNDRMDSMDIDVQREESEMQIGNIPRQTNRKRQWEHVVDDRSFKKRRDDADNKDAKKDLKTLTKEGNLLEDILMGTHGVSMYHWLCNQV